MEELLLQIKDISLAASARVMEFYCKLDKGDIEIKADTSPVTKADYAAHNFICTELQKLTPDIPILSEEGSHETFAERRKWSKFWLIDPLDGTKEFINQTGEFTINIALVEQHEAILGVVAVPVKQDIYFGCKGGGAYLQSRNGVVKKLKVASSSSKQANIRVAISRNHEFAPNLQPILAKLQPCEVIFCGSTLKIGLIAKGEVDIYPRLGVSYAWDTAAGQCILEEAGGKLVNFSGARLFYNIQESLQNPDFIAVANVDVLERLLPIAQA